MTQKLADTKYETHLWSDITASSSARRTVHISFSGTRPGSDRISSNLFSTWEAIGRSFARASWAPFQERLVVCVQNTAFFLSGDIGSYCLATWVEVFFDTLFIVSSGLATAFACTTPDQWRKQW
ncbi:uncharacterized protein MYCFIDRAFT_210219 [Pseudocercospora fijiensis CIRAD86]|uniref:Uncharacterized protein n=1 Tax=Pseudocercospora fijiensis (strain CIRAD86) TaxID=383855 RepID=M3ALD0_PSEFD|nr:uncharacterized protein MYCFIDRAFT_210219 [Pseudocercospora fijiensis CIRAD86]EME85391.1 hypothetical protein MYCFIDRAFT_210219 [Pseudocercospora fijiensis CIRAD86]